MEASKTSVSKDSAQIAAKWGEGTTVPQLYADELLLTLAKGRAYLTFGQLEIPPTSDVGKASAVIAPVARLVITQEAIRPMVDLLNKMLQGDEK